MGLFDNNLLISDMDGTLLNSEGEMSLENIKAINNFVKEGGIFTIATGRMRESVRKYLSFLPIKVPIILYNGSQIYDYNNEETIFQSFLSQNTKDMMKKVKEGNETLGIEIYIDENVYIYNPCKHTSRFSKSKGYNVFYLVDEDIWSKNWTKVLILGEKDELDFLQNNFQSSYGVANLVRSSSIYLEVLPKEISKGFALSKLISLLNIKEYIVTAVGDNMNDLEMLELAHHGFCVSNSPEELKNKIKNKSVSNDEHAIKWVINWLEKRS